MFEMDEPKNKIKVMFVISAFAYGAGKVLLETLKRIDRERFEPAVAVLWRRPEEFIPMLEGDINVYDLGARDTGLTLQAPGLVARLRRLIRQTRTGLVVGLLWDANIISVLATRSLPRTKVVLCEHTSPIGGLQRVYGTGLKGRMARWLTTTAYSIADSIVAVSSGVALELRTIGIPAGKLGMINNPIDLQAFGPLMATPTGLPRPYVLYVGQLVATKNIRLLVEAFKLGVTDTGIDLVLVGDGPQRVELEAMARTLGIHQRVIFIGYDSNPYKYMSRALALVLPSNSESLGLVLLEAMACRCAVVTTDSMPDPTEVVQDGINGLMVARGDAQAMAMAISRLINDRQLARRMIDKAAGSLERFDPDNAVRAYEKLFMEVLGQ